MVRYLSSAQTAFVKFGFTFSAIFALVLVLSLEIPKWRPSSWLLFVPASVVGYLVWISCWRLMRVGLDGETLVVSDYFHTWRIPTTEILALSERRFVSGRPIFIRFRTRQPFGEFLMFMPKMGIDFVGRPHPYIVELGALAGLK